MPTQRGAQCLETSDGPIVASAGERHGHRRSAESWRAAFALDPAGALSEVKLQHLLPYRCGHDQDPVIGGVPADERRSSNERDRRKSVRQHSDCG